MWCQKTKTNIKIEFFNLNNHNYKQKTQKNENCGQKKDKKRGLISELFTRNNAFLKSGNDHKKHISQSQNYFFSHFCCILKSIRVVLYLKSKDKVVGR